MRFVDLFSGLGGFHLAAAELGGECVFASEINPSLRSVYKENFGIEPAGDINDVAPNAVPDHDLLCAGFPCQPFSKAGEQAGWTDPVRGTVFYKLVEILREKQPRFLVLENVAHFVKHDRGNTYSRVRNALEGLGYQVKHTQLSPHQFGIPQIRERMYMVGRLGGGLGGFEFPKVSASNEALSVSSILDKCPLEAVPLNQQVVRCLNTWQQFLTKYPAEEKLPSFPIWSMEFGATYPTAYDNLRHAPIEELRASKGSFGVSLSGCEIDEILRRVPSHARHTKKAFPRWKQTFIRQNRELYLKNKSWMANWLPLIQTFPSSLQKCEWNCQGETRDIWRYVLQFRASGVRIKRPTTAPSLVAMTTSQIPIIGWEKRYMTARECARLQCMAALGCLPPGNAAFYALGNAVNVTVARKVIEQLLATGYENPKECILAPIETRRQSRAA